MSTPFQPRFLSAHKVLEIDSPSLAPASIKKPLDPCNSNHTVIQYILVARMILYKCETYKSLQNISDCLRLSCWRINVLLRIIKIRICEIVWLSRGRNEHPSTVTIQLLSFVHAVNYEFFAPDLTKATRRGSSCAIFSLSKISYSSTPSKIVESS